MVQLEPFNQLRKDMIAKCHGIQSEFMLSGKK